MFIDIPGQPQVELTGLEFQGSRSLIFRRNRVSTRTDSWSLPALSKTETKFHSQPRISVCQRGTWESKQCGRGAIGIISFSEIRREKEDSLKIILTVLALDQNNLLILREKNNLFLT